MKVKKIIQTSEINLSIEGVTLLTVEEVENAKEYIKEVDSSWWLRSPGLLYYTVALVKNNCFVRDYGTNVDSKNGVRPALKINLEFTNMRIGDSFWFGGYTWTVISKKRALCDNIMERMPFRVVWKEKDANVYETSDVKEWLDDWYEHVLKKYEVDNCGLCNSVEDIQKSIKVIQNALNYILNHAKVDGGCAENHIKVDKWQLNILKGYVDSVAHEEKNSNICMKCKYWDLTELDGDTSGWCFLRNIPKASTEKACKRKE